MKKKLHLSILLVLTVFYVQAQIPNADFELWQDEFPVGYVTTKTKLDTLFTPSNVTQTNDSYSGSSAILLETIDYPNLYTGDTDTLGGYAFTGDLSKKIKGFPLSTKPNTFSGYYKTAFDKRDTASIIIGLYKWNTGTAKRDSIGGATFYIDTTVSTYNHFSVSFKYLSASVVPDTAVLYLSSSGSHPIPGSTLYLDDLMFDEVVTATVSSTALEKTLAFPNPASETISFKNVPNNASKIEIVDMTGQLVAETSTASLVQLNVTSFAPGLYYYNIKSDKGSSLTTGKFSISR